jgi:hypothetical protein
MKPLVFTLSAAGFETAKDGNPVDVRYSPDSQGHGDFGKLDKPKVRK